MRLIDADALEELFREVISGIAKRPDMNRNMEHMIRASAMVIEMIKDAPTIEPECTGEWIYQTKFGRIECNVCGHVFKSYVYPRNFCPNCGARME